MAILLEGPDRCGKTTLARRLVEAAPGASYRHFTNPAKIAPCYRYYAWQLADAHAGMILDRLHPSDWAYGHVYKGGPELTFHRWRLLELMLHTLGTVVLRMEDDPARIRERWGPSEMFDVRGVDGLLARYREVLPVGDEPRDCPRATTLPTVALRWHEVERLDDAALLTTLFRDFAGTEAGPSARRATDLPPSRWLGRRDARFIIVGEAPPPTAPRSDDRGSDPDVPFSRGPAAAWLWRALDEVGLRWWKGAYTNASLFTPNEFRRAVIRSSQVRAGGQSNVTVVCLGHRAAALAREAGPLAGVDVRFCYHPSFVRRFRSREFDAWKSELGVALAPHLDDPATTLRELVALDDVEGWSDDE